MPSPCCRRCLLVSRDFIILLWLQFTGPCFFSAALHQLCWGPPLRFPPSVHYSRSALSSCRSAIHPEEGLFQRRSACVVRSRGASGCSSRKDKPWGTATLRRFSPLWGRQSKNRYSWSICFYSLLANRMAPYGSVLTIKHLCIYRLIQTVSA